MNLASLTVSSPNSISPAEIDQQFIEMSRSSFTQQEINSMPFWLEHTKSTYSSAVTTTTDVDVSSFNTEQRQVYDIVSLHLVSQKAIQLLMIVTGQAGSGKSYLINGIKQLLSELCIITSYFGIAAFNVKGQILHSLFQLPIRGKRNGELKGTAFQRLQENLANVQYIIIDEFSVLGQKMFGWIDHRYRQGTGNMDQLFGGLNVLLFGDMAQLPRSLTSCYITSIQPLKLVYKASLHTNSSKLLLNYVKISVRLLIQQKLLETCLFDYEMGTVPRKTGTSSFQEIQQISHLR